MRLLELFGGIGACSAALKRLGIDVEIADYVEIDKYAVQSYNAINGTNFEPQDITKWDKDIDVDMIMHGSPCQDFSLAGYQRGGDKGSGTRSSLMYETIRIVDKLHPKYVVWENVKNLLSKKHRHNFDAYLEALNELGYNNYYQVLNAKDYGIPQNRERVFTISIRKDIDDESFKFPEKQVLKLRLKDMLEDEVDEKYYLSEKMIEYIMFDNEKWEGSKKSVINKSVATTLNTGEGTRRCDASNYVCEDLPEDFDLKVIRKYGVFDKDGKTHQAGSVYDVNGLAPTLDTMQGGYRQPCIEEPYKILVKNNTKKGYQEAYEGDSINLQRLGSTTRRGRVGNQVAQTLDTQCEQGVVVVAAAMRGRGEGWKQQVEISDREYANCITTSTKDSMVAEKSLFTETQAKMFTPEGNVKRYINSDIVDEFKEGQCADISFPNGYNKGPRVHDVCPAINTTTTTKSSFVVKVPLKRGYSVEVRPELFDTTEIDIIGNYSKSDYNATPIVGKNGVAPTVRENHGQVTAITTKNKRIQKIVEDNDLSDKDPSFLDIYNQKVIYNECGTLKAGMDHQQGNIIYSHLRIRKLTPKECWRLMGFSDENFKKAEDIGISNTQLYKQAGNSIVVDVLYYIFANLFHIKINEENLEIRKDTNMYFNKQNKKNLKTNIMTLDELFDIEKLITKNPQLYAELCEKYPVKKECIYIIQYAHPEVKENVSEEVVKEATSSEEASISLEDKQESSKVEMSSTYGEIKAEDKNVENSTESAPENVENNVENHIDSNEEIDEAYPEDFQPLYKVNEKITIKYDYDKVIEPLHILQIKPRKDGDKITGYDYKVLIEVIAGVNDKSGIKIYSEDFLVEHELTK